MNTTSPTAASTLQATHSTRLAGAGFAAVLTLAMLLGVNTLASVDHPGAQMAKVQPAASAAQS
jgi:hypothetical protein